MSETLNGKADVAMTREQEEAYNEFIDYMVLLYQEYGQLAKESGYEQNGNATEPVG